MGETSATTAWRVPGTGKTYRFAGIFLYALRDKKFKFATPMETYRQSLVRAAFEKPKKSKANAIYCGVCRHKRTFTETGGGLSRTHS